MFLSRILVVVIAMSMHNLERSCNDESDITRLQELEHHAKVTYQNFYQRFETCYNTTMPNQKFLSNNIHSFINYPSKTTVGISPKFTSNRKFFANMIGNVAFKDMLEGDLLELRNDLIKKMKYCDQSVMDQNILKEYYDREVDLSKV